MNAKKKQGLRAECPVALPTDLELASPVIDAPALPAAVTAAPADPTSVPQELATQQEDYLRLAADFDNFKKRTRRDAEQQAAAQKEAFIADLLPVLDNLERALAAGQSSSSEQLQQGVTLTLEQLSQLLNRHGIAAVADIGQQFDPRRHEAVSVRHDPSQPDQLVLEVIQRGYCHGDKLFRPAKVIVNDLSDSAGASHAG